MNKKNSFWLILAAALLICIIASGITTLVLSSGKKDASYTYVPAEPIQPKFTSAYSTTAPPDFVYASEQSINAVVHVKTVSYVKGRHIVDPFEFFFGNPFLNQEPRRQVGMGSGVIISEDGYIVTNNHVIEGATDIEVTLNNKQTLQAQVIGTDPTTDIALIKVDAENLPFLHFGDSDELKVGEWVLAVGNPFNLTSTVTAGIVSAKGRNLGLLSENNTLGLESFIQTDAAVNAGNSGGALVNTRGELVGINTAIASPTGNFSGYSFAVPASIAQRVVEDLVQYGTVQRGLLMGVTMVELNAETVKKYNLNISDYQGVYVSRVNDGSAAAKAGLKTGDVITRINRAKVNSLAEAQEQIGRFRPSDEVPFTILRDGKERELNIVLNNKAGGLGLVTSGDEILASLGATFQELSNKDKESLGISYGLQVTEIRSGKLQEAGVRKSYIILRVNKTPIDSVEKLQSVLSQADGGVLVEGVYPNGRIVYYGVGI